MSSYNERSRSGGRGMVRAGRPRGRTAAAGFGLASAGLMVWTGASFACSAAAAMSAASPSAGPPGTQVVMTGQYFYQTTEPGAGNSIPVQVLFDGSSLARVYSSAQGLQFNVQVTIPSASPGSHILTLIGHNPDGSVAGQTGTSFEVTAPRPAFVPTPAASPGSGGGGGGAAVGTTTSSGQPSVSSSGSIPGGTGPVPSAPSSGVQSPQVVAGPSRSTTPSPAQATPSPSPSSAVSAAPVPTGAAIGAGTTAAVDNAVVSAANPIFNPAPAHAAGSAGGKGGAAGAGSNGPAPGAAPGAGGSVSGSIPTPGTSRLAPQTPFSGLSSLPPAWSAGSQGGAVEHLASGSSGHSLGFEVGVGLLAAGAVALSGAAGAAQVSRRRLARSDAGD